MKKTAIFLMMCLLVSATLEAKKKPFGNGLYWEVTKQGELIISGNGPMPDKVKPWWKYTWKGKVNKIIIEEGITSIGEWTFDDLRMGWEGKSYEIVRAVKEIILPQSLEKIGGQAFNGLRGVKRVVFRNKLSYIGEGAFRNCYSLEYVNLPSSIRNIEDEAFKNCYSLKKIIIPEGVERIGKEAFCKNTCTYPTPTYVPYSEISVPKTVQSIGYEAFSIKYERYESTDKKRIIAYTCNILSLPSYVNSTNCTNIGISQESLEAYVGIVNSQGKQILATKQGRKVERKKDEFDNSIYYEVNDNGNQGILADNGQWIVPVVKGRKVTRHHATRNEPTYYEIIDESGKGYINANGQWIISTDKGYNNIVELSSGNTKCYKVSKSKYSGPYGLISSTGRIILPTEYSVLETAGGRYLRYKVGDFYGIMDYQGNVIIPTTKGYTSIGNYMSSQNSFTYTTYGYKGEVDSNCRELSRIKVETSVAKTNSSSSNKSSSTTSTSTSNNSNSGNRTSTVVVEHHRDPVPVQEWQQCIACFGSGQCPFVQCGGSGWYYIGDKASTCSRCHGSGKCTICAGRGGQYVTVYR